MRKLFVIGIAILTLATLGKAMDRQPSEDEFVEVIIDEHREEEYTYKLRRIAACLNIKKLYMDAIEAQKKTETDQED